VHNARSRAKEEADDGETQEKRNADFIFRDEEQGTRDKGQEIRARD